MIRKITFVISFLMLCQFCAFSQNWQAEGGGAMPPALAIRSFSLDSQNNRLLACAYMGATQRTLQFTTANNWDSLGGLLPGLPYCIVTYRGENYVAAGNIYKLNGANWQLFATTHGGGISSLYVHDTDLFVGGMFDSIGGIAASKIARYDGYNWNAISNAAWGGSAVNSTLIYQNDLYIGGGFYSFPANTYKISKCDWSQWQNLGNYFSGGFDFVTCLTEYNGYLYVGGYFSNGCPGNYIARWDGTTWTQVGGGLDGQIFCMKVFNGELWVGGAFTTAGGIACPYIAKYNGTDWCNVGNFDNTVTAIEEYNGELYVGGSFWTVDTDTVPPVVKWIGGSNTNACGHLNTGIGETFSTSFSANVFPNPATTSATFYFTGEHGLLDISIFDQLGREVLRKQSDETEMKINTAEFAPGLYYYRVNESGEAKATGKLIIE